MVRRYNSFLVRCWIFDGDTWRIQVEHVQSGDRTQVALPEEAMAWIRAYCAKPLDTAPGAKPGAAAPHEQPGARVPDVKPGAAAPHEQRPGAMAHSDRDDSQG